MMCSLVTREAGLGRRLLMTYRTVLDVFVPVVGCAESWSLRASGQAFVNDIVFFMFCHVIGCAESWSLRASGQASVNDIAYCP